MKNEEMDTLFHELLQEQKQINQKLSSFTRILMELNDKTAKQGSDDDLEKLIERARVIQTAVQSIPQQMALPKKQIEELTHALQYYHSQLKIPLKQKIVHHVHKIWIVAITFFIILVIEACWIWKLKQATSVGSMPPGEQVQKNDRQDPPSSIREQRKSQKSGH